MGVYVPRAPEDARRKTKSQRPDSRFGRRSDPARFEGFALARRPTSTIVQNQVRAAPPRHSASGPSLPPGQVACVTFLTENLVRRGGVCGDQYLAAFSSNHARDPMVGESRWQDPAAREAVNADV